MHKKIIIALTLLLTFPSVIYAQNADTSLASYPPLITINASKPTKVTAEITVQNNAEKQEALSITYKKIITSPRNNGSVIHVGSDSSYDSLFKNITILDNDNPVTRVSVLPYEAKKLKIVIDTTSLPISDYYFAIIFTNQNITSSTNTQSAITAAVATNVILSIGQGKKISGEILAFKAPFLTTSGNIPVELLVANQGEKYITPRGNITIKNMFGKEIARLDILPQNILKGSSRYLVDTNQAQKNSSLAHPSITWNDNFMFGIYQAKLNLKLSPDSPVFTRNIYFAYFPLMAIAIITVLAFVAISIYIKVRKKI